METNENNIENADLPIVLELVEPPTVKDQVVAAAVVTGVTLGVYAGAYALAVGYNAFTEWRHDKKLEKASKKRAEDAAKEVLIVDAN